MEKMATGTRPIFIKVVAWLPAICWMAIIFIFSSRQSVSVASSFWLNFLFFKSIHIAEYAILTALYAYSIKSTFNSMKLADVALCSATFAILYGSLDELHQTFVPTRNGQILDVLIDAIGVLSVYSIMKVYEKSPKILAPYIRFWKSQ